MKNFAKRTVSLLLALAVILGISPVWQLGVEAATGDRLDYAESFDIDTNDYISLPIEIYDYYNDGMLFEFASSNARGSHKIQFIAPEIENGWNFTMGEYACKDIIALKSKTGYNSLKINGTFTLETYSGNGDGGYYDTTYLRSLRAWRSVSGGSGFTAGGAVSSNVERELLTLGDLGGIKARYMVLGYWLGYSSHINGDGLYVFNRTSYTSKPSYTGSRVSLKANGAWTEQLIDMGSVQTLNIVSINPIIAQGDYTPRINISHAAFFETKAEAEAFMAETEYRSYNANRDNHGFGMVGSSRGTNTSSTATGYHRIGSTYLASSGSISTVSGASKKILTLGINANGVLPTLSKNALGYSLYATIGDNVNSNCSYTIGLLNHNLNEDGNPTYTDDAITYIAGLLEHTLTIPLVDSSNTGRYNYSYVSGKTNAKLYGTKADGTPSDLADAIRRAVNKTASANRMGTLAATKNKHSQLVGHSAKTVFDNGYITTYMDAAYFLLNNLFVEEVYSEKYDAYDSLRLAKATIDGQECYVFDAGFATSVGGPSATVYDEVNRVIYNSASATKAYSSMDQEDSYRTTTYAFLPLTQRNNEGGDTDIPYWLDDGADDIAGVFDTYDERDYNFVMKSEGQFIYEKDKNLFFEFEGDDDVYLFINGELVLDCGGAHPVATHRIYINDYVEAANAAVNNKAATDRDQKLNLVDGETYSFSFFYMERKGYGANLRVMTNMKVTDTKISGDKDAYQNGSLLPNGSGITFGTPVEYAFKVTNNGDDTFAGGGQSSTIQDNALMKLTFKDKDLGLTIGYNGIVKSGGLSSRVTDAAGGVLEPKDLTFVLSDADGNTVKHYTPVSEGEMKAFLTNPFGTGIECGMTLTVRGIYITLEESDFKNSIFTNHLDITCTTDANQLLTAAGICQLRNLPALNFYQGVGQPVTQSKTDLYNYIVSTVTWNADEGMPKIPSASAISSIKVTTASGSSVSSDEIYFDSNGNLVLNYKEDGIHQNYITVTYTVNGETYTVTVPVVTNTFKTQDQVFVLDYGLTVDLSDKNAILADMTDLPGSTNILEGMSIQKPTYVTGSGKNNLTGITTTGDTNFSFASGSLFYRPEGFMENSEKIFAIVRAYKNGATPSAVGTTNAQKEVEMFKGVTVLPANVVYYEDDFPAIKYHNTGNKNEIVTDGTAVGSSGQAAYLLIDFKADSPLNTTATSHWGLIQKGSTLSINTSGIGIATLETDGSTASPYMRTGTITGLNYTLKEGDVVLARIRTTATSGTPTGVKFWYRDSSENVNLNEDTNRVLAAKDVVINDGQWHVVDLGAIDASHFGKLLHSFQFSNSYQSAYTGKCEIDYIYVGPAAWANLMQDNDQDTPYGSDSHYQGNSGDYSGTGYHKIEITNKNANLFSAADASFTFMGTGFELIGRTNATDSATIVVRVKDKDGNRIKLIPVITEFDNQNVTGEDLYQVPTVKINDLTFGQYTVEITGIPAREYDENGNDTGKIRPTYLYIDGIRIYNPLGTSDLTKYYDDEQGAVFTDLRDMLEANQAAAVQWSGNTLKVDTFNYGYTENRIGTAYDTIGTYDGHASKINDYLLAGPNNELYLSSESNKQAVVMYVKETVANQAGMLQVAMRLVNDDKYYGTTDNSGADTGKVYLGTGSSWIIVDESVISGTEQYYNIDYTKCPTENGYYRVVLAVAPTTASGAIISFTNVKSKGLTFKESTGTEATIRFGDDGRVMVPYTGEGSEAINDEDTVEMNTTEENEGTWITLSEEESAKYMRLDLIAKQMGATEVIDPALANRNGVHNIDGTLYYFVNGEIYNAVGLVELGGKYYYVRSGGNVAIGKYWVTNTNGLMPEGYYFFGEDGAMIFNEEPNRAIIEENGTLYYYVDGVKQYGAGLIELDGNYYYIRSGGQAAIGLYWVTNTNGLMPEGFYYFSTDGRMVMDVETAKNGIFEENGCWFYYVDGKVQYGAGLVIVDGAYYYIRSGGYAATGTYWVTNANGLLPEGFYEFGADGKMIDPPTV